MNILDTTWTNEPNETFFFPLLLLGTINKPIIFLDINNRPIGNEQIQ
jgi:hypothetical protein